MIFKYRITDANGTYASFKVDATDDTAAQKKATKLLREEDVKSGSLLEPFTLELMEEKK